jgi:hypothetical protein
MDTIMASFSFEHSSRFTEDQYVRLTNLASKKMSIFKKLILLVIGIICLFWVYSLLFGIFILILAFLSIFMPRTIPGTLANNFRKIESLHDEIVYGVNEKKLWMRSSRMEVIVSWDLIKVWCEIEDYLRLSSDASFVFWYPISRLKELGIYSSIKELCYRNAVEFNSKTSEKESEDRWVTH